MSAEVLPPVAANYGDIYRTLASRLSSIFYEGGPQDIVSVAESRSLQIQ